MMANDVKLSKSLSYILRHSNGRIVDIDSAGFADVQQLLQLPQLRHASVEDVQRVVRNNDKQRFTLISTQNGLRIRANQGHSFRVPDLELNPIDIDRAASEFDNVVVHATFFRFWPPISKQGLSKMNRQHIHFLPVSRLETVLTTGKFADCDLLIYVDLAKAIGDGFEFFLSANNVVLCPGNQNGLLPTSYFLKVERKLSDGDMQILEIPLSSDAELTAGKGESKSEYLHS